MCQICTRSFAYLLLCYFSLPALFDWFAVQTKFLTKPKGSITTYKNWDTTLKCDIFGYPFPVITWTRSLNKLPVNRYVIDGDTLTIKNTIEDDGGAYICQGANELGSVMAVTWVVVTNEGEQTPPHPLPPPPNTLPLKAWLEKYHCYYYYYYFIFFKWILTLCQVLPAKFKCEMLAIMWSYIVPVVACRYLTSNGSRMDVLFFPRQCVTGRTQFKVKLLFIASGRVTLGSTNVDFTMTKMEQRKPAQP